MEGALGNFLAHYDIGTLRGHQPLGTRAGVTRHLLSTTIGTHLLFTFAPSARKPPFFLRVMDYLAQRGIPCPAPLRAVTGESVQALDRESAALVPRPAGETRREPTARHCHAVGSLLAQMHRAGLPFGAERANRRGPDWVRATAQAVAVQDMPGAQMLHEELRLQALYRFADLPRGLIHADLTRESVLFLDERVSSVLDFEHACTDVLLLDVAVAVNHWCTGAGGDLDRESACAFLAGYDAIRPFTALERGAWPVMLRSAALRTWLGALEAGRIDESGRARDLLAAHVRGERSLRTLWPEHAAAPRRRA